MTDPGNDDGDRQERGVDASNQEFRRYEQVDKEQSYRLSEAEGEEQFDDDYRIPICDIGPLLAGSDLGAADFSRQLGAALEGIGFAILVGHGVDPELYRACEERTRDFFETIPVADRQPYLARRHGSVNQGYFPIRKTSNIHPDLVEGWVFCRRAFDLDGRPDFREADFWPRRGDEPFFRRLVQAHEKLILPIMQGILRHLGCDPHLYDRRLERTNVGFRLNYYPPLAEGDGSRGGRMLGHEDVDLFTILPASSEGGLQVLNRSNGKWIRLHAPPGSIILNTGDYMQRISNDRIPSTTHRVSRPDDPAAGSRPRISLPMAVYVWEDELLEVLPGLGEPKYEPIRAIQFHTRITSKYYGDDYAVE